MAFVAPHPTNKPLYLEIRYSSATPRPLKYWINGHFQSTIAGGRNNSWNNPTLIDTKEIPKNILRDDNTLKIQNTGSYFPHISSIIIRQGTKGIDPITPAAGDLCGTDRTLNGITSIETCKARCSNNDNGTFNCGAIFYNNDGTCKLYTNPNNCGLMNGNWTAYRK